jgi:hypothetical protein
MAKKTEGEEGKKPKKVDMMRAAFDKFGIDGDLDEIQKYIKDTYGEELSKPHISQTKTSERKRLGMKGKRRRRGRPSLAETAAASNEMAGGNTLDIAEVLALFADIQRYKDKLGSKNVQKIVTKALS